MNLKKVFIFIEAGYVWKKGISDEQNNLFVQEIKEILTALGWGDWTKELSMAAWECFKGENERIYCHPMELTGVIDIDNGLKEIEEALKKAKHIKYRHTDIYDAKPNDFYFQEKRKAARVQIS